MSLVTVAPPQGRVAEVADLALVEDRHVGGPAAQLHQRDPDLLLVVGEHRQGGGQRLEHQLGHLVAGAVHRLADVLRGRGASR